MNQKLLLLIGAPRSGTTLLNAMIGCHPDIAMLNEDFGHAVFNLVSKPVVGNKLCVPNQIELSERGSYVRRQFQKRNFRQYAPQADLSIEDYLSRNANIVATVRHPDRVIGSIVSRGKKNVKLATYRWARSIEIIDTLVQQHAARVLVLAYPFLVSEPENVMRSVSSFVGVEYDPAMLEGYAHTPIYANKEIDSSKAEEMHLPVSDGILTAHAETVSKYESLIALASKAASSNNA
ncbi:MAG: sulfotransferase [Rhodothermales bacterium]|nr:sulfotransferase [Rhodothermales bacterium]